MKREKARYDVRRVTSEGVAGWEAGRRRRRRDVSEISSCYDSRVQKNKVEYSERNFSIGGTPRGRKIVRSGALSPPSSLLPPTAPAAHVFTA